MKTQLSVHSAYSAAAKALLLYQCLMVSTSQWCTVAASMVLLRNANDIINFSKSVSNGTSYNGTTVLLGADIDFSGSSDEFEPIGWWNSDTEYNAFAGIFDGQGHVIRNFAVNSSSQNVGLFGYSKNASIRNLVFDSSCTFTNSHQKYNICTVGPIGFYDGDAKHVVEGIVNMGSVTFSGKEANFVDGGGIVGKLRGVFTLRNCVNYGNVIHSSTARYAYLGGIAGECIGTESGSTKKGVIQSCLNYGSVISNGKTINASNIGGIVGYSQESCSYEKCLSAGAVNPNNNSGSAGGIVGGISYKALVDISTCFWTDAVELDEPCGTENCGTSGAEKVNNSLSKDIMDKLDDSGNNKKWILNANNYSVTFYVNGNETFSSSAPVIFLPSFSTEGGHKFSGWFTNKGCTNLFNSSEIAENATKLYGIWSYTITFNFGNGTNISTELTYNDTINYPTVTREGYTFSGWVPKPERMPAEDITVVAQWVKDSSQYVEIVIVSKDLSKEELENIIKRFTDDIFYIEKIENDDETNGTRIIIRFTDPANADDFVDAVKSASNSDNPFIHARIYIGAVVSSSPVLLPLHNFILF